MGKTAKAKQPLPVVCNRCEHYGHGTCSEPRSTRFAVYPDMAGCGLFMPVRFFEGGRKAD